mgnify:FL=1
MKSSLFLIVGIYVYVTVFLLLLAIGSQADEILYRFKSPSFSGVNTSSHYLTIENQEATRKTTVKKK